MSSATTAELDFCPVDDRFFRLQRLLRLAPHDGFGVARRIVLFVLIALLPLVVWAAATGNLHAGVWSDAVARHLGLLVRGLVAIPLYILAEPLADRVLRRMIGNLVPSGLVRPDEVPRLAAILKSMKRVRDSWLVWLGLVGLVGLTIASSLTRMDQLDADAVMWGSTAAGPNFGAMWGLYVVRPLFVFYTLVWLWRLVVCWILFRRFARLDLQLVPSHPDAVGGLGFFEGFPVAFGPVMLAISCVFCAFAAHQVQAHGATVKDFQAPLIGFAVVLVALFGAPLLSFMRPLRMARIRGRFQYGALAGRHVRGVHTRWIEGKPVEDDVLSAPEIGPVADVATLYYLGAGMRAAPIGKGTLVALLWPVAVPVLLLISLEVPLQDILLKILGALG